MLKIGNNKNNVSFGMNKTKICKTKSGSTGTLKAGKKLNSLSKDIFISNIKEGKSMNNKEKQVKLLNDYVNYYIDFDELIKGRKELNNNHNEDKNDVDENIENLFNNFDEDPYYTQTEFSFDARELLNIYRKKNKYSNILNEND